MYMTLLPVEVNLTENERKSYGIIVVFPGSIDQ